MVKQQNMEHMDYTYDEYEEEDDRPLSHAEHKENGNAAYKAKDYRGAILHYTLAIETASPDIVANGFSEKDTLATYYNNRAAAATMILHYDDALQDCETILNFHPHFVKALNRKAKILTLMGRLDEANSVYNLALYKLDGRDHASERNDILKLQKDIQTLSQRVALIKSLLQTDATTASSSSSPVSSGHANQELKKLVPLLNISKVDGSQALKQMSLILSSCPQYKELLPYQLQSYIITEKFDDAYTLSSKLLRTKSNDCMVLYYRSYILYQKGMIQDSIKHLKQILRVDPDHALSQKLFKALRNLSQQKDLGDEQYKAANYQKASEYYTEAIDNPICVGTLKSKLYYNRSCTLFYLKSYKECIQDCNDALKIDDEYVKVYMRRGNAYVNLDECTERDCMEAIADYEKAIELLERQSSSSGSETDEKQMKNLKTKIHEAKIQIKQMKQKGISTFPYV